MITRGFYVQYDDSMAMHCNCVQIGVGIDISSYMAAITASDNLDALAVLCNVVDKI